MINSRQAKLRGRGSRKAETSHRNSVGKMESHPERLATPGSESCVVIRDDGTKRRQPVPKPCD